MKGTSYLKLSVFVLPLAILVSCGKDEGPGEPAVYVPPAAVVPVNPGLPAPTAPAVLGPKRFYGPLIVTNRDRFALALRATQQCDRMAQNPFVFGVEFGNAKCSYWAKSGHINITTYGDGSQANISISAGRSGSASWGPASVYYNGGSIGFDVHATVQLTNHDSGVLMRSQGHSSGYPTQGGYAGYPPIIKLIAPNDTLESPSLRAVLLHENTEFAQVVAEQY